MSHILWKSILLAASALAQQRAFVLHDLICNFQYQLNHPLAVNDLTSVKWYLWANTMSILAPKACLQWDSYASFTENHDTNSLDYSVGAHPCRTQYPLLGSFTFSPINTTNGEFAHITSGGAKRYMRVLERFEARGNVRLIFVTICNYESSDLSLVLLASAPIKDPTFASGLITDFQQRYLKYYPADFYLPVVITNPYKS
jgi:hypothetical protein